MGVALPVLAIGGAVASAVGAISSGIAQSQSANYQAQVARNNQLEATQNATYAIEAGDVKQEIAGRQAAAQLGAVKAGIAADNIDTDSGSALDVESAQRQTGLLSQENVKQDAATTAYGYQTQGTSYESQAALDQAQANTAIPGSLLSAAGDLGKSVGNLPPKFFGFGSNSEPPS